MSISKCYFPYQRRVRQLSTLHRRPCPSQIGGLGPFEDPSGVNPDLAPKARLARPIADQAAELGERAPLVARRNGKPCRQRDELFAPAVEERIGADEERAGLQLEERAEGRVDLAFRAGLQDNELHP